MVRSLFRITNSKPFKASMAQQERPITLWCFCLGMESRGVLYSGSSSYSSPTTIIEDKRCPLLGSLFGRGDCSTHEQRFRLIVQLPAGHNEHSGSPQNGQNGKDRYLEETLGGKWPQRKTLVEDRF